MQATVNGWPRHQLRRNIAENFNPTRRVHERYRRQTDRQQTDGWATAYKISSSLLKKTAYVQYRSMRRSVK